VSPSAIITMTIVLLVVVGGFIGLVGVAVHKERQKRADLS
jgi:hypothetical protein